MPSIDREEAPETTPDCAGGVFGRHNRGNHAPYSRDPLAPVKMSECPDLAPSPLLTGPRLEVPVDPKPTADITSILLAWREGRSGALDDLMPLVYGELRSLARGHARREGPGHTLGSTGVLHEAYLRLADKKHPQWKGRVHFFAVVAQLMRRILIDHARGKGAAKRGGSASRVPLERVRESSPPAPAAEVPDVLALDQAIRRLARLDPRKSRAIELCYFGGLTHREAGDILGVSAATVRLDTRLARAWLARELRRSG